MGIADDREKLEVAIEEVGRLEREVAALRFTASEDLMYLRRVDMRANRTRFEAWDAGFTAGAMQHMKQQLDPSHPITRTNPHGADL